MNFQRLERCRDFLIRENDLSEYKIMTYPYGVGSSEKRLHCEHYENNDGLGSKFTENDSKSGGDCRIISLDEFIDEPYSFLKADIESYEYQMLLGAQEGIKKNKPLLAICIYHNSVDIYSIPLLVKKFVPEYKIAVRHHGEDLSETVMYAWV